MGGSGKQKALALIGDRLLDMKLYQGLLSSGEEREGWMTQKRSMLVSNENLSRCALDMLIPEIMSKKDYLTLSTHEKGTLLEAYLGVLYVQDSFQITLDLNTTINECLTKLQSYLNESKDVIQGDSTLFTKSQYKSPPDRKKAKSTLLEVLQKRGVDKAASFFTTWSIETPNFPPFISKFEANFDLVYCNLPDPGPMIGEPCLSKKDAEESAAAKVLQFFRDRELMVFAPEKSHLIQSNALNPPTLAEQIEALQQELMLASTSSSPSSSSSTGDITPPTYNQVEIHSGVFITLVVGGTIPEIVHQSQEDFIKSTKNNQLLANHIIILPESLPLPEVFQEQKKRPLDPKKWSLCSNDILMSSTPPTTTTTSSSTSSNTTPNSNIISSSTVQNSRTIFDGPYSKKFRKSESNNDVDGVNEENRNGCEEGEVTIDEEECKRLELEEREQENLRVRENLIALRQTRQLSETKKAENYRKYATKRRGSGGSKADRETSE